MKRILATVITVCTFAVVSAQNSRIDDFMDYLSSHGARVSVSRINDKYHLSRRYHVMFENDSLLADSICVFLDQMARRAVESYRYESHRNGQDTITYSVAMKGYGTNDDYLLDLTRVEDPSSSWTSDYSDFRRTHTYMYPNSYMEQERRFYELLGGNNRKMYFGAREAVMFDYSGGRGNIISVCTEINRARGMYYHFDITPLDALLASLDGQKVHYQHESGEPIYMDNTYYFTDYLLPKTKGKSESTGRLYVVGPNEGAANLYRQLLNAAKHHLDANPTQCCVLEYSDRHFKLSGVKNTTKLLVNEIAESSFLMADLDKNGSLYILRLDVNGEYWIPRNWKQK